MGVAVDQRGGPLVLAVDPEVPALVEALAEHQPEGLGGVGDGGVDGGVAVVEDADVGAGPGREPLAVGGDRTGGGIGGTTRGGAQHDLVDVEAGAGAGGAAQHVVALAEAHPGGGGAGRERHRVAGSGLGDRAVEGDRDVVAVELHQARPAGRREGACGARTTVPGMPHSAMATGSATLAVLYQSRV